MEVMNREDVPDGILLVDGFDDCILGIGSRCGQEDIAIYSSDLIVEKIMKRDGVSWDDAYQDFEYNTLGSYVGEKTPIFLFQ
jgi:hypothetical protein